MYMIVLLQFYPLAKYRSLKEFEENYVELFRQYHVKWVFFCFLFFIENGFNVAFSQISWTRYFLLWLIGWLNDFNCIPSCLGLVSALTLGFWLSYFNGASAFVGYLMLTLSI